LSPNNFINKTIENSDVKIYFVESNKNNDYLGYNKDNTTEEIYEIGNILNGTTEFEQDKNCYLYNNNLQFFIQNKWEFSTYVKSVNLNSINNLHNCLKKILNQSHNLTLDDLKEIITTKAIKARKCYKSRIGDINSHGLILLHGPINFTHLIGHISSNNLMSYAYNYLRDFSDMYGHFRSYRNGVLYTLLFGDTSLKKGNNQVKFPSKFKPKLQKVHITQVPHHGSAVNWDFNEFIKLKVGNSLSIWKDKTISVCNFGYGNRYGHPSPNVINDLSSSIFLNTQFSRLNINYDIIYYR
jgi:hypothetical protein